MLPQTHETVVDFQVADRKASDIGERTTAIHRQGISGRVAPSSPRVVARAQHLPSVLPAVRANPLKARRSPAACWPHNSNRRRLRNKFLLDYTFGFRPPPRRSETKNNSGKAWAAFGVGGVWRGRRPTTPNAS